MLNARRLRLFAVAFFLLLSSTLLPRSFAAVPARDSVGDLIDQEKQAEAEWLSERGDLPSVLLNGDASGIEVFSPEASETGGSPALCEGLEVETLADLSGEPDASGRIELNTSMASIREPIRRACLVRPGDEFIAIGNGHQSCVKTVGFFIKREPGRCGAPAHSLWMDLAGPLAAPPLFYSASADLAEGTNTVTGSGIDALTVSDGETIRRLGARVRFIDEFAILASSVSARNLDRLLHLKRLRVDLDDADLPNEMLFAERGDSLQLLLSTRVDPKRGSGRIRIDAIIDIQADGAAEVAASIVERDCLRPFFFDGSDDGLILGPAPDKPCGCP